MRKLSISKINIFGVGSALRRQRSLKVKSRRKAAPTGRQIFILWSGFRRDLGLGSSQRLTRRFQWGCAR